MVLAFVLALACVFAPLLALVAASCRRSVASAIVDVAEVGAEAVAQYLEHQDWNAREAACKFLGDLGQASGVVVGVDERANNARAHMLIYQQASLHMPIHTCSQMRTHTRTHTLHV